MSEDSKPTPKPPKQPPAIHPAAALMPEPTPEERDLLKRDIDRHGVRVAIIRTPDGRTLDGRTREQIAVELGIACPSRLATTSEMLDPIGFVLSLNAVRRHLSPDQVAAIWLKHRQPVTLTPSRDGTGRSAAKAGKTLGVSTSTVERVQRVAKVAPEKLDEVATGKTSANAVLKEIRQESAAEEPAAARPIEATEEPLPEQAETEVARKEILSKWCQRQRQRIVYRSENVFGLTDDDTERVIFTGLHVSSAGSVYRTGVHNLCLDRTELRAIADDVLGSREPVVAIDVPGEVIEPKQIPAEPGSPQDVQTVREHQWVCPGCGTHMMGQHRDGCAWEEERRALGPRRQREEGGNDSPESVLALIKSWQFQSARLIKKLTSYRKEDGQYVTVISAAMMPEIAETVDQLQLEVERYSGRHQWSGRKKLVLQGEAIVSRESA